MAHSPLAAIQRAEGTLHVLVNNAGAVSRTSIMDIGIAEW
jgi:NAD(P)-dependent dehydrogenase (short-subunit alcohol dehydrogenase family)